ncbi:hypothetical protein WJX84_004193 [Apatococcus fuscideae]|uniref:STI1/HOP DP domain-containing protein n=1 Tax=Apatococcus fuscideae TaxID=2026836 RepID=A0AAW1TI67_9CHLO
MANKDNGAPAGFPGMPPGMPGMPGMPGGGPFDFAALQGILNDPSIKQMAEQIAQDPSFRQMTAAMQSSMGGMMPNAAADESTGRGAGGAPPVDPANYAEAMSGVLQNPQFMEMAEKLGQQIMQQDPSMAAMMSNMTGNNQRENVEEKLKSLKDDPELAPIMKEIEEGGPTAMMKYWNDPKVLEKLSSAMGGAFGGMPGMPGMAGMPGAAGINGAGPDAEEEEGEEEEDLGEATVHSAASAGEVDNLRELIEAGEDKNAKDEEGRTALHFAAGYGEDDCVKLLLEKGADINACDNNKNSPLHYAAGYGIVSCVQLLVDGKANQKAKNDDEKMPVEVAELNDQTDVIAILKGTKTAETTEKEEAKAT